MPRATARGTGNRAGSAGATDGSSEIAQRRERRRASSGRRSDTRWQEILAGAARAFTSLGYSRTTLEDVAAEVGVNRATLYYYVGTKEELLVALLHDPIEQMRSRLEQIAAKPTPAADRLAEALRAYGEAMERTPELFIFLSENLHQSMTGAEADDIRRNADRYGRVLTRLIKDGAKAGEFRRDIEPQTAVLGIIGMFNWIHRWYDPNGRRKLTEFTDAFVEMALSSLAPR